jgi:eukaryotic-like serine/threonine-protein kinase
MIGESVGAYTVLSEIGRGGMGVVYLAEHRHLGRKAAIKFLLREFTHRPGVLQRFFTEARASSLIEHDGIVRIFDCDTHPTGYPYIVMEYLEGTTLRAHLASRGPLPFPEALAVMLPICEAMSAAHAKEIVHRDLKPDNLFLLDRPRGAIKIVDFGVAKLGGVTADAPTRTQSGTLLGTPLYMSPEQARGAGEVDARTDVYSLGCVLFEMLCGRPPFIHPSMGELIAAHLREPPPTVESIESSVPPGLCALINLMLAKSPDERPSLPELIPVLQAFSRGRGTGHDTTVGGEAVWETAPALRAAQFAGMAALPADSTLRYANGETGAAPRRRGLRWATSIVALLAIAGGAAVWRPWRALRHLPPPSPPVATAPVEELAPAPAPTWPEPAPAPPPATETPHARLVRAGRTVRERSVHLTIASDPPGAAVCLPDRQRRIATTNGTVKLRSTPRQHTLLVYRLGYRIEEIKVPGDQDSSRSVKLDRLAEDDLKELPPCR